MKGDKSNIAPIMTHGDLVKQFMDNAYNKPATGLNILRETIMGRELFDFAFKQYAQRWMFKHPTPEDLFRTLEDASAVDLDWFWRGWFYGTDHVDIALDGVTAMELKSGNPAEEKAIQKKEAEATPETIAVQRNRASMQSMVERDPDMKDFYNDYDPYASSKSDVQAYGLYKRSMSTAERKLRAKGGFIYQLDFSNVGGMVMPLVIRFEYEDGSTEIQRIPAQVWNQNELKTSKVFFLEKKLTGVTLDPYQETADCDLNNNHWPPRIEKNRFELYRGSGMRRGAASNPMQEQEDQ
jgi:hypothetical protein